MPVVIDESSPAAVACASIKEMLDAYMAAEKAVLSGVSYRWGERQLTMANLPEIVAGRKEWEAKYAECLRCANGQRRFGGLKTSLAVLNPDCDTDTGGCGGGCS